MLNGLKVVLNSMVAPIQKNLPQKTLKFWRLQSPRHFHGGELNQNSSCMFEEPLEEPQLDLWFDTCNNGVNKKPDYLIILLRRHCVFFMQTTFRTISQLAIRNQIQPMCTG